MEFIEGLILGFVLVFYLLCCIGIAVVFIFKMIERQREKKKEKEKFEDYKNY